MHCDIDMIFQGKSRKAVLGGQGIEIGAAPAFARLTRHVPRVDADGGGGKFKVGEAMPVQRHAEIPVPIP